MWSNSMNTQTHTVQMRGKSASTYLCSCRRTLFSHHTLSEFHCSLSHHCHLRSPFLHHSATAQERSSHQDCTEIPSHCTFQEREFLRKIRITLRNLLMWVFFFFPIPSLHWLRILFLTQAKIRVPRYKCLIPSYNSSLQHKLQTNSFLSSSLPSLLLHHMLNTNFHFLFSHLSDRKEFGCIRRNKADEVSLVLCKPCASSSSWISSSFLVLLFYPARSTSWCTKPARHSSALTRPPHLPGFAVPALAQQLELSQTPQQRSFTQCSPGISADCFEQSLLGDFNYSSHTLFSKHFLAYGLFNFILAFLFPNYYNCISVI